MGEKSLVSLCEVSAEVTHRVHPNHTRPGLHAHPGVNTHTHTPRAVPSPGCEQRWQRGTPALDGVHSKCRTRPHLHGDRG